jgi:5'-3' exonuclease
LDIRDGALDFLFNVYKRILPTLGDFITNHGGEVNLSHVDVILAEVGAIEDYVFQMKHENEANQKRRMADMKARKKKLKNGAVPYFNRSGEEPPPKVRGRAARILEKTEDSSEAKDADLLERNKNLSKNRHAPKPKEAAHKKSLEDNNRAAEELKASLMGANGNGSNKTNGDTTVDKTADINMEGVTDENPSKRKADQISTTDNTDEVAVTSENTENSKADNTNGNSESNGNNKTGDKDEESKEQPEPVDSAKLLKEKMKNEGQKKLDAYADNVEDKVRLHEPGWKVRFTFLLMLYPVISIQWYNSTNKITFVVCTEPILY